MTHLIFTLIIAGVAGFFTMLVINAAFVGGRKLKDVGEQLEEVPGLRKAYTFLVRAFVGLFGSLLLLAFLFSNHLL